MKCLKNGNITKDEMSQMKKCHKKWNLKKLSLKMKSHKICHKRQMGQKTKLSVLSDLPSLSDDLAYLWSAQTMFLKPRCRRDTYEKLLSVLKIVSTVMDPVTIRNIPILAHSASH